MKTGRRSTGKSRRRAVGRLRFWAVLAVVAIAVSTWSSWGRRSEARADGQPAETGIRAVDEAGHEIPVYTGKRPPEQILKRLAYTTSYNPTTLNPNWVGWVLTSEHTDGEHVRRGHSFKEDREVPEPRATHADIREGECGYQRGHMCPAADNKWSAQAQKEAFLMTNICPQNGNLNQRDWKYLEEACREWAQRYGRIYIVAGPIFHEEPRSRVGEHGVAVPDAFFKVVLAESETTGSTQAIGFVYANRAGTHDMGYYVRSIDEVERITGLDFFGGLDDEVEERIERESDLASWTD